MSPNGTCAKRRRRLLARISWGLAQMCAWARRRGAVGKSRASRSMRSTVPIGDDRGDGPIGIRMRFAGIRLCGQLRAKVGGHLLGRFCRRWQGIGSSGYRRWEVADRCPHRPGALQLPPSLSDRLPPFPGGCPWSSECAAATIPVAPMRSIVASFARSRRCSHRRRVIALTSELTSGLAVYLWPVLR